MTVHCPDCNKDYARQDGLVRHLKKFHASEVARSVLPKETPTEEEADPNAEEKEPEEPTDRPLSKQIARFVSEFDESKEGDIFRVRGVDYRVIDGVPTHCFFPKGPRTDLEDGAFLRCGESLFQFVDGKPRPLSPAQTLAAMMEIEETPDPDDPDNPQFNDDPDDGETGE